MSTGAPQPAALEAHQVVVGRQPITDRHGDVVGYELLYRPGRAGAGRPSGEVMTAQVLLGALSIGIDRLVGPHRMFCNAERNVLVGDVPLTLPPERTVIEVLETVRIDDETVNGCRRLVRQGFTLALDDFVWVEGAERLLSLASIVKIDVLALTRAEVSEVVARCRPFGVQLLAEKVESATDVAWAMAEGFELFQGYAIERPVVVHGQTIGGSATAQVQLAASVLTDDLDFDQLEQILRREPGLVVQLLQMASAGSQFGLRGKVRSVREALVLLGTVRVRQFVALSMLHDGSGQSLDAMTTALTRAKTCELLAVARGLDSPDFAFTAGLLSTLDLLMGLGEEQLEDLELDNDLKRAAFGHAGPVGRVVADVLDHQEVLRWPSRPPRPGPRSGPHSRSVDLDDVAAEAFAWAMPLLGDLAA